ncbi:MAG TPA: hypothetical protein PKZ76_10045 [Xanthomonadaceae bacterium]|nr:hypothetical protein [Xanthomonadaceae bacterium]
MFAGWAGASPAQDIAADIAYLAHDGLYWQVAVTDARGEAHHVLTASEGDKTRVSWFPDGRRLLVNVADGRLFELNIATGEERPVPLPLEGMLDAALSPDGRHIVFSLSTSGSVDANNLWLFDLEGEEIRKLTHMARMQHEPTWNRNGTAVYFLSGDGGQNHDIWKVEVATGSTAQLTAGMLYHFDVAVGPDGWLAFSSNRSGAYQIWAMDDLQAVSQLTDHPALDARPSWSPDGSHLVFESSRGGDMGLWRMARNGDEPQRLSPQERPARFPVWRQQEASR